MPVDGVLIGVTDVTDGCQSRVTTVPVGDSVVT